MSVSVRLTFLKAILPVSAALRQHSSLLWHARGQPAAFVTQTHKAFSTKNKRKEEVHSLSSTDPLKEAKEAAKAAKTAAKGAAKAAKEAERTAKIALRDSEKAAAEAEKYAQIVADLQAKEKADRVATKATKGKSAQRVVEEAEPPSAGATAGLAGQTVTVGPGPNPSQEEMNHMLTALGNPEEHMEEFLRENPQFTKEEYEKAMVPIMLAASKGSLEEVKVLAASGEDIHYADEEGWSALMVAASEGHVDIVKYLISGDVLVDQKDIHGCTPLIFAAMEGHVNCIKVLLEAGADVNWYDNNYQGALQHAVHNGRLEATKALLEAGADIYHEDHCGFTALDLAHSAPEEDPALIEYLENKLEEISLSH